MKERQLIGMVEYVIYSDYKYDYSDLEMVLYRRSVNNYANFLNQPLELGMFVPCDEYGNVYESEPQVLNTFTTGLQKLEYQAAKERVIFEGFEVTVTEFGFTLNDGVSSKVDVVLEPDFMRKDIKYLINYRVVYVTESTYNKYF